MYCSCEQFDKAGRTRLWIANGHEESKNLQSAIDEYKLTTKYFEAAKMPAQVLHCDRKIAHLLASTGEYEEASTMFKQIGSKELLHNLTKYSAYKSFFQSSLFLFYRVMRNEPPFDFQPIRDHIACLCKEDFRFEASASCDFLQNIILLMATESCSLDEFIDHIYDFNNAYPFNIRCLDVIEYMLQRRFNEQIESSQNVPSQE